MPDSAKLPNDLSRASDTLRGVIDHRAAEYRRMHRDSLVDKALIEADIRSWHEALDALAGWRTEQLKDDDPVSPRYVDLFVDYSRRAIRDGRNGAFAPVVLAAVVRALGSPKTEQGFRSPQKSQSVDEPLSISLPMEQWLAVSHYAEEHLGCIPGTPDPDVRKAIRVIERDCDKRLKEIGAA